MRKWKLGLIAVVIAVLGLLVWGFLSLGIFVPRVHVVHIETPGGPVPVCIVFLDPDTAYVEVGYDGYPGNFKIKSGDRGEFLINEFHRSPLSYEIEFPRDQMVLQMGTVSREDGSSEFVGKLMTIQDSELVGELAVSSARVSNMNWFGGTNDQQKPVTGFQLDGDWALKSEYGSEIARMRIGSYTTTKHSATHAEAQVLTFITDHRDFAGVVTGNRIRLASFDNAYPALIDATIQDDGTLKGDFWIGDRLHESFVGTRK